ncbi:MAG: Serine/threonine protein kinase [Bacteroidota bacterium]|nr:Serine/threonine protein kinase [Bacteroidota bacterium]
MIEIIVIVLKAYFKQYDPTRKKQKRLWITLAGLGVLACLGLLIHPMISIVIFIIFLLLIVVPVAGLVFIVPVYMTIRHARSFAITNQSLEEQLIQVRELSAKAIEQEQEKKKILETQNERLEQMVTERTAELAQKNLEIKDSINYAQRIQNAILTTRSEINATLKECFILFKPKDVVSGDFYFFAKKENTAIIAAADCTGHGVPGALMSMIATEKLIAATMDSTHPSVILNTLNKGIKTSLKQSDQEGSTRDGMDIALTAINLETKRISYAGANRPVWIIRNGSKEVEEIKATKKAIGGFTAEDQQFEAHELDLKREIRITYLQMGMPISSGQTEKN